MLIKRELVILVGPPGAGKSTYAKKELPNHVYINQDLQGQTGYISNLNNAFSNWQNVVIDRLNHLKVQREGFIKQARDNGYKTKIIVLHVPKEECMRRCTERKNHPTIKDASTAAKAIHMFFSKYDRVEDNEADQVSRLGWDGSKDNALIIDIDGTLANIEHRLTYLKGESDSESSQKNDWKKFFSKISEDSVNEWCSEIIYRFQDSTKVVLCSGRPDDYMSVTKTWLHKNNIHYDHLLMRKRNDYRPDTIIKQIILDFEIKTRYKVIFSVDDRPIVCKMWRQNGITTLQCNDRDF